jgi:urease accessory protein
MFDAAAALVLMQHGDSAYPAGGFAFSWGVEGLAADGFLTGRDRLDQLLHDHLTRRWNSMDRPLLGRAYGAASLDEIAVVDRYAEAATASAPMREGSRRAGRALLNISAKLGGSLSVGYRALAAEEPNQGHLPVIQAVAYRDAGLDLVGAELVSGWTLLTGLVSAAVRLGIVGHVEAQRSVALARPTLALILGDVQPEGVQPSSFTPLIDIAVSRSRSRPQRMFTT